MADESGDETSADTRPLNVTVVAPSRGLKDCKVFEDIWDRLVMGPDEPEEGPRNVGFPSPSLPCQEGMEPLSVLHNSDLVVLLLRTPLIPDKPVHEFTLSLLRHCLNQGIPENTHLTILVHPTISFRVRRELLETLEHWAEGQQGRIRPRLGTLLLKYFPKKGVIRNSGLSAYGYWRQKLPGQISEDVPPKEALPQINNITVYERNFSKPDSVCRAIETELTAVIDQISSGEAEPLIERQYTPQGMRKLETWPGSPEDETRKEKFGKEEDIKFFLYNERQINPVTVHWRVHHVHESTGDPAFPETGPEEGNSIGPDVLDLRIVRTNDLDEPPSDGPHIITSTILHREAALRKIAPIKILSGIEKHTEQVWDSTWEALGHYPRAFVIAAPILGILWGLHAITCKLAILGPVCKAIYAGWDATKKLTHIFPPPLNKWVPPMVLWGLVSVAILVVLWVKRSDKVWEWRQRLRTRRWED